jgi:CHAT domain-containing protein
LADLDEARSFLPQIEREVLADQFVAMIDATQARVLAPTDPERAIALLEKPIPFFDRALPGLTPGLRLLRARSFLALGRVDAATQDLEVGIRWLEGQRAGMKNVALQASVFDEGASVFDEMVALQLDRRHDPERALYFIERSRGRQLAETLLAGAGGSKSAMSTRLAPLSPQALRRELPEGVALVYYATETDRLVAWVLTRQGSQMRERTLSSRLLENQVVGYEAAIDGAAPLATLRERSAVLFDELVRPLLPALQSESALLFIPGPLLQALPFASLWDRERERYLVEDYRLGTAPSGTIFVHASAAALSAGRGRPSRLLAVGNPRLDRSTKLPDLPRAEVEARAVASLYSDAQLLTSKAATKAEFLSRLPASEVVHFAGHALPGDERSDGTLLLSSDSDGQAPGALYPREIDGTNLQGTRVVVLAGCRTGTGASSRLEGAMSLARPFLAAGVPSVVASLRDVDDDVSRDFSVAFHRALLADGDSAQAVRQAQLAFLRSGDATRAHPSSWAGFVNVGGFKPPEPPREARSK